MKRLLLSPVFFIKIAVALLMTAILVFLFSFTLRQKMVDDFLKQLGMTKTDANIKIVSSVLEGYFDAEGVKNIKNIATGNKPAIAKELLIYTKQYLNSAAFIKEYNILKQQKKPVIPVVQTPDEMRKGMVNDLKKSIADLEQKLKTADGQMKQVFEKTLETIRKQLPVAEDPNNKSIASYTKGYSDLVKDRDDNYAKRIAEWEAKYPSNYQHFVKYRLQQFLEETKDIDFDAGLHEKKGVRYFTNKAYESKSDRWKMAFRAGKEVMEPARAFVQEWIRSIQQ